MRRCNILVTDDDEVTCNLLREVLEGQGYSVFVAHSAEEAMRYSEKYFFSVVLTDIRMGESSGLQLLSHFKRISSNTVVLVMTGFGSMETAVQAIREGAFDYLSKPFQLNELIQIVKKAVKHSADLVLSKREEPTKKPSSAAGNHEPRVVVGSSPKMLEVYKLLGRAAMSQASVLLVGESGTGKEMIARAIHENSARRERKFLAVNCGALTDSLLESELFGHTKGAFTGAIDHRKGLFEEASGGTLLLDEIGDVSAQVQVKLLRVLQEGEIRAVGSNEIKKVDVRIIAATHRDLLQRVSEGLFREDLYYRLKVLTLEIPPLRDRCEDIAELAQYFLQKYALKNKKWVSHFSDAAMRVLVAYDWPGNVRELENVIEQSVALVNTMEIDAMDLPRELTSGKSKGGANGPEAVSTTQASGSVELHEVERDHILSTLKRAGFNKSRAAEMLGIDRTTLYRKAQRYGIQLEESI